jgi:hypothetical protein
MKKLFILFILLLPILVYGKNWYVSNTTNGNGNADSWANAKRWTDLNTGNLAAGDTVWFDGGTDSLEYNSTATWFISCSGNISEHIVFTRGVSAGHNGKPIITGTTQYPFYLQSNSYVEISYLKFYPNTNWNRVGVYGGNANNIFILHNEFDFTYGHGISASGHFWTIQHNTFETQNLTGSVFNDLQSHATGSAGGYPQQDPIAIRNSYGNDIGYNTMIVRTAIVGDYSRDIVQMADYNQSALPYPTKIHSNFIVLNFSNPLSQTEILTIQNAGGTIWFYNNIVVVNNCTTTLFSFSKNASWLSLHYYNNTLALNTANNSMGYLVNLDSLSFKNNLVNMTATQLASFVGNTPKYDFDYNQYEGSSLSNFMNGTSYTNWIGEGHDPHSSTEGFGLVDNNFATLSLTPTDYALATGSNGIDNGTDLTSYFKDDYSGTSRPLGTAWDVGAFEGTGLKVGSDTTPPNLLNASVLNSTTIALSFSEALESTSALEKTNYSINNGITVNSVSLSTDGKKVILNTTTNSADQTYTVVVNNVKDLAGNAISSKYNSAQYQYFSQTGNLAMIPIVSASATNWYLNYTPDRTIDGQGISNPDSRWAGAFAMPDTIKFDLGALKNISRIRTSFYDWDLGRVYRFSLLTSSDGINWQTVVSQVWSNNSEWTENDFNPVNARYLSLISLESNLSEYAGIYEMEVWGQPNSSGTDITPPNLLSAAVLNLTSVQLLFSEELDNISAQNKSNYSINNGITIKGILLSTNKKSVILTTSQMTTNTNYTVTVSNIKDLAGNIISSNTTATYLSVDNTVGNLRANVKVYLEGPYQNGGLVTSLYENELLPSSQPYKNAPWFYNGNESINSNLSTTVDWILVELRSAQNPAQVISRRAGLLRNDGRIMDTDGSLGITFNNVLYGSYYIAVFHRNHLSVMSSVPILFAPDNNLYDFTTSQSKAYGQNAMVEISTGVFGMYSGDGDANGIINDIDRNELWSNQNGNLGYLNGDFNLDSGVTIKDINDFWNLNNGKSSQVP